MEAASQSFLRAHESAEITVKIKLFKSLTVRQDVSQQRGIQGLKLQPCKKT
jgi:hypothetical protein